MIKKYVFPTLIFIAVLMTALEILNSLQISSKTGILKVYSSDQAATLAISKSYGQAQYIGLDSAKVRLDPGTYLVSASVGSIREMSSVQIVKGQVVTKSFDMRTLTQQADKNNNLISKLPITGPASEYTIAYYLIFTGGQSSPVITISSYSDKGKQDALAWLGYYGFKPSDYQIIYITTTPPPVDANYFNPAAN